MGVEYFQFKSIPDAAILEGIIQLHIAIFGVSDDLAGRMKEKPQLQIDVALDDKKVVGYKIGYALNREQFYSWLGGVDPEYRNLGIALTLMMRENLKSFLKRSY